ncbi:MAG: response regulator [Herbinix sp.]|nr:response regulator [Herbinix sp.]
MFHIMVVEDDPNTRKLMKTVLEQNGYETALAKDGIEALEMLDKLHVDLIVLDIMMPRMDGYEFTRSQIVNEHQLVVGDTVLKYDELCAYFQGMKIEFPNKEFMLLYKLLSYANKIFTRRQLMDELWSMDSDTDERTVDVHVNRIRERLKENEDFEIVTVRGLGYKAVKKE